MSIKVNSPYVNSVQKVNFAATPEVKETKEEKAEVPVAEADKVDVKKTVESPEISGTRLFFSRLTDEQREKINKGAKLPANGKFVRDGYGGYMVRPNWFGVTPGTRTLPAGFELDKDFLGFTNVLPKDTESILIKK